MKTILILLMVCIGIMPAHAQLLKKLKSKVDQSAKDVKDKVKDKAEKTPDRVIDHAANKVETKAEGKIDSKENKVNSKVDKTVDKVDSVKIKKVPEKSPKDSVTGNAIIKVMEKQELLNDVTLNKHYNMKNRFFYFLANERK